MALARMRVTWQGWPGAPGYSNFYCEAAAGALPLAQIRTFFDTVKSYLPAGLTLSFPGSGDIIDPATGNLSGAWSETAQTNVVGTGSGNYAGNAGAVVHWLTDSIVRGRRLRGRTFLVPLVTGAYDTLGSLGTTPLATLQSAASTLVGAASTPLEVWSRPGPGYAGSQGTVTSSRVPDLAVSMRSRRI